MKEMSATAIAISHQSKHAEKSPLQIVGAQVHKDLSFYRDAVSDGIAEKVSPTEAEKREWFERLWRLKNGISTGELKKNRFGYYADPQTNLLWEYYRDGSNMVGA